MPNFAKKMFYENETLSRLALQRIFKSAAN